MTATGDPFKAAIDGSMQFMVLLRHDGTILHAGRTALNLARAKPDTLLAHPFWEGPWWPQHQRGRLHDAALSAARGEQVRLEVDAITADGNSAALDLSITPIESGDEQLLLAEGHDITTRRGNDAALQATLARLKGVLESALDPVITIDQYGTIQSASRSIQRVFGYTPEEVIGRNVSLLMPNPHKDSHDSYLANYRRTGQTNILGRTREFHAQRRDGTLFPIELSVSRVDIPGQQALFTGIIHDLSDRRKAEEQLRQTEALLSSVVDNATSIVFAKDLDGRYTLVNKRFQTTWGLTREELVGKTAREVFPKSLATHVIDSDKKAIETLQPVHTEEVLDFSDGPHTFMSSRVALVGPDGKTYGICGISTDITEHKRVEEELRLLQTISLSISGAHSLGEALSNTLRDICQATSWDFGEAWLPAQDGGSLTVAQSWISPGPHSAKLAELAAQATNVSIQAGMSIAGRVWHEHRSIWYPDLAALPSDQFPRAQQMIKAGASAGGGIPILLANEVVAVLLFFVHRSRSQDSRLLKLVSGAAAQLGNAVQRKRAEDELDKYRRQLEELVKQRTSQLEESHEQLRSADRLASIGTLAAGLGHDMNNVLLPIRCRLDAMDAKTLPKDTQDHFAAVRKSVSYLQQLSDGLHLLALDPGEDGASGESTDIHEWWEQVGPLLRRAAPKHADFQVDIPENLPRVTVAPHRLTQAILNLVVNSGEAIPKSGGRIRLWAKESDGAMERQSDSKAKKSKARRSAPPVVPSHVPLVEIGVTDNGYGMSEDVKRRALDPFFTTKKRGLGTGLGLALVQGVAQTAGGDVRLESLPGKGTTVTMRLPAAQGAPVAAAETPTAAVTLQDERVASFVCSFLRAAGVEPSRLEAAKAPGTNPCWVTDPTPAALAAAKQFLKVKGRCVVTIGVAGPEAQQWKKAGAVTLESVSDFENFRRVMGQAIDAATGNES